MKSLRRFTANVIRPKYKQCIASQTNNPSGSKSARPFCVTWRTFHTNLPTFVRFQCYALRVSNLSSTQHPTPNTPIQNEKKNWIVSFTQNCGLFHFHGVRRLHSEQLSGRHVTLRVLMDNMTARLLTGLGYNGSPFNVPLDDCLLWEWLSHYSVDCLLSLSVSLREKTEVTLCVIGLDTFVS